MLAPTSHPKLIIVEFGSQLTMRFSAVGRKHGVRSVVLGPSKVEAWVKENPPEAVILSGGYNSVYEQDAPQIPECLLNLRHPNGGPLPIAGICYGAQLIAKQFGGRVEPGQRGEYAETRIHRSSSSVLFSGLPIEHVTWMSHSDAITAIPPGFELIAKSTGGQVAAFEDHGRRIYALTFHPESAHTEHGDTIIGNFLDKIAGLQHDWDASSLVGSIRAQLDRDVGKGTAIMGGSGGVDSSVAIAMAAPVLKQRLKVLTIDADNLREDELNEIERNIAAAGVQDPEILHAPDAFLRAMEGIVDAEERRFAFIREYQYCFVGTARRVGATHAIQGTNLADKIESGRTGGDKIKTHHNLGAVFSGLTSLHPLQDYFKYEIRGLARDLGLPDFIVNRHPFPGPGLFLRILWCSITRQNLELLRWADARAKEVLRSASAPDGRSWYENIDQLVVAYTEQPVTGQKGDRRAYHGGVFVRAVQTHDFITARGVYFPESVWRDIEKVLTSHPHINRAWPDSNHKPPGTTEYM